MNQFLYFRRAGRVFDTGVVGAKYYPPSGYGATVASIPDRPKRWRGLIYQGGARKQWKHRYDPLSDQQVRDDWGIVVQHPDKAREETLAGVSARFFQFAADENLVMFAHQSPGGFEAYPGYGSTFAEPCSWLPVVHTHPEVLLVLGHAGGFAWYSDDAGFDNSFARQAYNMCVTYENVYCDFGYHEEILTDAGQNTLRDRLLKFHEAGTASGGVTLTPQSCRQQQAPMQYSIFDKLLYGSDWMMVVKERSYEKMAESFEKVFTGELAQYRSRFFGENAVRLLQKAGNADQLPEPIRP